MQTTKHWQVYLAGEIHSDWRQTITGQSKSLSLPITFTSPQENHENSDRCGQAILGQQNSDYWNDHIASGINGMRTKTLIKDADVVVVCFGEKFKQWNAAFDAGYAAALNRPIIIMHPESHNHALKEVDRAAMAVTRTPDQVVSILKYIIKGEL